MAKMVREIQVLQLQLKTARFHYIGSIILLSDVNELEQVIAIISHFVFRNCIRVILESESSRLNANMVTLFAKKEKNNVNSDALIFFAALLILRCFAVHSRGRVSTRELIN